MFLILFYNFKWKIRIIFDPKRVSFFVDIEKINRQLNYWLIVSLSFLGTIRKHLFLCNSRMSQISCSVCPLAYLSASSIVCGKARSLPWKMLHLGRFWSYSQISWTGYPGTNISLFNPFVAKKKVLWHRLTASIL